MSSSDGNDPSDLSTRRLDRWTSSVVTRGAPPAGADPLAVRRFTLLVIAGPDAGNRVVATGERLTVGGHPSAELRLGDPAVGPFHFELAASAKQVVLRDLDPARGTMVDGVAVRVAHLRDGSVITAGGSALRFDT